VHLNTVLGKRALRHKHHAGAIDEDVDRRDIYPGENLGGTSADSFLARELQLERPVVDIRE
jgi:hypothetical protein